MTNYQSIPTTYPMPQQGASGVNIHIYQPTATPCSPVNYAPPVYTQPINAGQTNIYNSGYVPQNVQDNYPNSLENQNMQNKIAGNFPLAELGKDSSAASSASSSVTNPNDPKAKRKRDIVKLTDDYIKNLETYFRNQNKEVRLLGIKELANRYEEDRSRVDDEALRSLLNLGLQDPNKDVRLFALSILASGYAKGNDFTKEILQRIQKSNYAGGHDALLASEILLKFNDENINVVDNSHPITKKRNKGEINE